MKRIKNDDDDVFNYFYNFLNVLKKNNFMFIKSSLLTAGG